MTYFYCMNRSCVTLCIFLTVVFQTFGQHIGVNILSVNKVLYESVYLQDSLNERQVYDHLFKQFMYMTGPNTRCQGTHGANKSSHFNSSQTRCQMTINHFKGRSRSRAYTGPTRHWLWGVILHSFCLLFESTVSCVPLNP